MYKLQNKPFDEFIIRLSDHAFIPMVDGNADYEDYKKWLSKGNKPQEPDLWPIAENNKTKASQLLYETDWTQANDVEILNKDEFASYRSILRQIALNPVAGPLDWPEKPQAVWPQ